jgi:predicted DNA-binding mobile mystery protein A
MSTTDLAARLGVNQTTVARIEANERSGRVQLDTLARAADALGCDLVYAIIPREPLETSVDNRARKIAVKQMSAVDHSMALEDQRVSGSAAHDQLRDHIERLRDRPGLWRDE